MEVIKYLKQIYLGKKALSTHIMLFSLCGIMVILLVKYAASWANLLVPDFFILPPSTNQELFLEASFGVFISIYLIGYGFKFINNIYDKEKVFLPDFTLSEISILLKMLPVIIIWLLYYISTTFCGMYFLLTYNQLVLSYIFASVMVCLTPFILMKYVTFASDFKYSYEIFNPKTILKYLDRALGDVIYLSLEVFIMLLIPIAIIYFSFRYATTLSSDSLKLGLRLGGLCIGTYILFVANLIYYAGLARIIRKKFVAVN